MSTANGRQLMNFRRNYKSGKLIGSRELRANIDITTRVCSIYII